MKRALTLLLALLLSVSCALAEQPYEAAMQNARQTLERYGYPVTDDVFAMALEQINAMQEWHAQFGIQATTSHHDMVYQLLLCEGIGEYDYDAMVFTPTSDKIYVFDAEFFNIEGMYTEFLHGVQAIMPDAQITAVREDLTGMNAYLEGSRKVFFEFNGHSYVVTLKSDGDWLNAEIIDFLNKVLTTEGYPGRLRIVSDAYDQIVFLIYGTEEEAASLRRLLGTEAPQESGNPLLEWLGNLLGI